MSICSKCKEEKPDSLFVTIKGKRFGMVCRKCRNAQIVEARKNRDAIAQRQAEKEALVATGSAKCSKCDTIKPDDLFPQQKGKRHGSVCKECTQGLKKMWHAETDRAKAARLKQERREEAARKKEEAKIERARLRATALLPSSSTVCGKCHVEKPNTQFLIINGKRHGRRCNACATACAKQNREKKLQETPATHRAMRSHEANMRRAGVAKRLPGWADKKAIAKIYRNRPEGHHVDHVIPLFGKLVSGLHVENNLQYLPAADNMKKNRKYDPTE